MARRRIPLQRALVVGLNARFYKGLQIKSSYNVVARYRLGQSTQTFTANNNVLNPFDSAWNRGRSNLTSPAGSNFGGVWDSDFTEEERMMEKQLLNGFTISRPHHDSPVCFTPLLQGLVRPNTDSRRCT